MRLFRWRRRPHSEQSSDDVLSAQEFEVEMEKKTITMLGMDLHEFRSRALEGELPETPAADHLRFLLGV